jgi:uncharacterized protein
MKTTKKVLAAIGGLAVLAGANASAQSLIDQWNFNEASGTTAANAVGGGASATLVNGASFSGSGGVTLSGGTASGAYINLGNSLLNGLTSVTFEAWFTSAQANNSCLFCFDSNGGASGTLLRFNLGDTGNGHGGKDYLESLSGWGGQHLDSTVLQANQPTHIAVVYDPTSNYEAIYLNGSLANSYTGSLVALSTFGSVNGGLGRSPWTSDNKMAGTFDQFSIYNGVLSGTQIAADFASGPVAVPEPGACAMFASGFGLLLAGFRMRKNK